MARLYWFGVICGLLISPVAYGADGNTTTLNSSMYLFQARFDEISWKGSIGAVAVAVSVFVVVILRDVLGIYDFGES